MIKIYIIKLTYKIKREKKIIMIINTINKPIFYCTPPNTTIELKSSTGEWIISSLYLTLMIVCVPL
jgi:hypothetical protein